MSLTFMKHSGWIKLTYNELKFYHLQCVKRKLMEITGVSDSCDITMAGKHNIIFTKFN